MGSVQGAILFFVVALATRLPFRTENLWSHDAVLYARAVADFDPSAQRPHPPGYLWYVLVVRAVSFVTDDVNAAMTLISAVAAAAAVALVFVLASEMYDRRTGVAAALFLLTSVTFWGESAVAYPYTLLALLTVLVVLLLWRAMSRRSDALFVAASLAWGIAMGARLDVALLAPVWIVAATVATVRGRLLAAAAAAVPIAVWIAATGLASGDLARSIAAAQEQSAFISRRYGVIEGGPERLVANARETVRYVGRALYALVPLVAATALLGLARRPRPDRRTAFLLAWVLSPLPVFLLVHIGEYGYVFGILPGLCVIAADGARRCADRLALPRVRPALVGAIVAANAAIFLFSASPLGAADLARRDLGTAEKISYIRSAMDPSRTLIAAAYETLLVEHYLGGTYAIVGFDPDARAGVRSLCVDGCAGVTLVVWDDLVRTVGSHWREVALPGGSTLRVAEIPARGSLRSRGLSLQIDPAEAQPPPR